MCKQEIIRNIEANRLPCQQCGEFVPVDELEEERGLCCQCQIIPF